jgi:RimJ/RimL family protein N-acetyltransferase
MATLRGSGVTLAPLKREHAPALVEAASDGELWALEVTTVPSATTVDAYIERALVGAADGTMLPFVIKLGKAGTVIGSTRFWRMDAKTRSLEIGHTWIAKSQQGSFVNPAIKYLMLRYAFEIINCMRVQFMTDENNAHSRAAILKLGAKEEGILRQERIMPDGRKRNSAIYSIIDSEWPEVKATLEARLRALNVEPSFSAMTF